jgi:RNA polymerase sigma-70 factor (ECF subfamily)
MKNSPFLDTSLFRCNLVGVPDAGTQMTAALFFARDAWGKDDSAAPRWVTRRPPTAKAAEPDAVTNGVTPEARMLIERVQAGDRAAFDGLSAQYWDALWRYAYRHVQASDVADDVVQDVLFDLWCRREKLDPNRPVRAYLFGAVRRHALELLRHERVVNRAATTYDPIVVAGIGTHIHDAADDVEQQDFIQALERLLTTISPRRREILLLRWWHGLPYDEIASVVGLGVSAVKMHVHRAVAQFRPLLEQEFRRE